MWTDHIFVGLFATGILIFLFFVLREIFCWYWKVNAQIEILEEILTELKRMNKQ